MKVHSILKNKKAHADKIRALFSKLGDVTWPFRSMASDEARIRETAVTAVAPGAIICQLASRW